MPAVLRWLAVICLCLLIEPITGLCRFHEGGEPFRDSNGRIPTCDRPAEIRCPARYTCTNRFIECPVGASVCPIPSRICCPDVVADTSGLLTASQQLRGFAPGSNTTKSIATQFVRVQTALRSLVTRGDNSSIPDLRANPAFVQAFNAELGRCPLKNRSPCLPLSHYRTADGSCNNLEHIDWGKSNTNQLRFLDPVYDSVTGAPRRLGKDSVPLPSARKVSNDVFLDNTGPKLSPDNTVMVMGWGQFIDHDFIRTPMSTGPGGVPLDCCGEGAESIEECFSIPIPPDDPHFTDTDCMSVSRSSPGSNPDCSIGFRQQVNVLTSYIDASNVYDSTLAGTNFLRTGTKGRLKRKGRLLPPGESPCQKPSPPQGTPLPYCFLAGDLRVNIVPSLAATHNTFLLEHNRIANKLRKINKHWGDEVIFQETRKIIGALMQQITYSEYLPILLNDDMMTEYGLKVSTGHDDVYDDTVNAATSNAFGAATFRLGHTQIPHVQGIMDTDGEMETTNLERTFFTPTMVQHPNGKNQAGMFRWLTREPAARTDRIFEKAIRDLLFVDFEQHSFDLTALNIQRGRDHGIPSYNDWREWCNLDRATNFETDPGGLVDHSQDNADRLKTAYNDVDDIELFPGGVTEEHVEGANIGPTFACMIARQFKNWKVGDRFWHERPGSTGFTPAQLKQIKKMTLAKIICRNQRLKSIQRNVFRKIDEDSNPLVNCKALKDMALRKWKESPAVTAQKMQNSGISVG